MTATRGTSSRPGVEVARNGGVRSRIVAKQFANDTVHEYFAATPDFVCFRLLAGLLATRRHDVACVVDAVSAFLQSVPEDGYVVRPPTLVPKPNTMWLLHKALLGLRKSSHLWQDHQAVQFVEHGGFMLNSLELCVFHKHGCDIFLENHSDDTLAIGSYEQIQWFRQWVNEHFKCNISAIIGYDQGTANEGHLLKRRF